MKETTNQKPLPENIKNSIYIHHISDNNFHIYAKLLSMLPRDSKLDSENPLEKKTAKHSGFLRPARDGKNLSFIERKKEIADCSDIHKQKTCDFKNYLETNCQKRLIELFFDEKENLAKLSFESTILYSDLNEFAENQNLILNLTQQENIEFPTISDINLVEGNIFLLSFENETYALISKNQLLAVINSNSKLQNQPTKIDEKEKIPLALNQTLLPPPLNNKRKFEDDNLNKRTKYTKKEEEKDKTKENAKNTGHTEYHILEDSKSPTL